MGTLFPCHVRVSEPGPQRPDRTDVREEVVLDRALIFLYEQVLGVGLGEIGPVDRADLPGRLPTMLSREEVQRLFAVSCTRSRRSMSTQAASTGGTGRAARALLRGLHGPLQPVAHTM